MRVVEFALLHSLSVSSVALESAHSHQQQLDKWVQATPRLNKQAAGGAASHQRELQSLLSQPSTLQPYLHILNTTQRMTRATARKAQLLAQQQEQEDSRAKDERKPAVAAVLSELRLAHNNGSEHSHVFQTPSSRVR